MKSIIINDLTHQTSNIYLNEKQYESIHKEKWCLQYKLFRQTYSAFHFLYTTIGVPIAIHWGES